MHSTPSLAAPLVLGLVSGVLIVAPLQVDLDIGPPVNVKRGGDFLMVVGITGSYDDFGTYLHP